MDGLLEKIPVDRKEGIENTITLVKSNKKMLGRAMDGSECGLAIIWILMNLHLALILLRWAFF